MANIFRVGILGFFLLQPSLYAQVSDFSNYSYVKADSIAGLYPNHSIANLNALSIKLTSNLSSDIEKFRAIYKWVSDNIENDYSLYIKNKRMREKLINKPSELSDWNRQFHPKVFNKLLKDHSTVCTGYAYLIKELCYYAGIKSEIINGYGRTAKANIGGVGIANHSWNSVELNNKWYLCDATWSSGSINTEAYSFIKRFNEAYFLPDPILFIQNHYPLDSSWFLLANPPTLDEFLNAPLVYKDAFNYGLSPELPNTFETVVKKGKTLTFKFKTKKELSNAVGKIELRQSNSSNSANSKIYEDSLGNYCMDYQFTSKGAFDVHILLDGHYTYSYSIRVVK